MPPGFRPKCRDRQGERGIGNVTSPPGHWATGDNKMVRTMNIQIDPSLTLLQGISDREARNRAEWEKQQAREDRAALAAMDVVEELSGAQSDDWQFNYLMEFFGMHLAKVVRARVASGWQETPLEADALDKVADYADFIKEWRDEKPLIFAALDELANVARQAARAIREDEAKPVPAPF